MRQNPIDIWSEYYPYVESISSERETIEILKNSGNAGVVIDSHIGRIKSVIAEIEPIVSEKYKSWSLESSSYNFGLEAYYQHRILNIISKLQTSVYRIGPDVGVVCARQIINPSAIDGTPRVKRIADVSFVIFPAPTVFWMYAIFEMISEIANGRQIEERSISEYLRYIIGVRTFARHVKPVKAYAIDFLADEIVHHHSPVRQFDESKERLPLTFTLIRAAEEFVLCHELAHLTLQHDESSDVAIEAAADRRALEMMIVMHPGLSEKIDTTEYDPDQTPEALLGYLAVKLWTMVRLAAEYKATSYIADTDLQAERMRDDIMNKFHHRMRQVEIANLPRSLQAPRALVPIVDACSEFIKQIAACQIDRENIDEMRKLAIGLASDRYELLSNRLFSDARLRQAQSSGFGE